MRALAAIVLCLTTHAGAGTLVADTPAPEPPRRSILSPYEPIRQPEPPGSPVPANGAAAPMSIGAGAQIDRDLARPTSYGVGGSRRFSAGLRGAQDFEGYTDNSLFAQQTWFVVDDVEIGVEGAAWWIFQDDDTWGVSSSLIVRYHFYQASRFSAFVEGGIGLFIAADNVPDEGTSFGFMPRVGAGGSWLIDNRDTRLLLGIHWHHISNARLNGEARNPSRDGVALYAAVSVPF